MASRLCTRQTSPGRCFLIKKSPGAIPPSKVEDDRWWKHFCLILFWFSVFESWPPTLLFSFFCFFPLAQLSHHLDKFSHQLYLQHLTTGAWIFPPNLHYFFGLPSSFFLFPSSFFLLPSSSSSFLPAPFPSFLFVPSSSFAFLLPFPSLDSRRSHDSSRPNAPTQPGGMREAIK